MYDNKNYHIRKNCLQKMDLFDSDTLNKKEVVTFFIQRFPLVSAIVNYTLASGKITSQTLSIVTQRNLYQF